MSRLRAEVYPAVSYLRSFVAALFCIAVLSASLAAQDSTPVPPIVKFSGTISRATSGTVGVLFALYKDQTGGAPLWQEVQSIPVDANGHYTAFLGARSAQGLPVDVFSSGEARWLGILPEGQAEQPRVLLVSVPYALKASDAETLGGLPASAFLRADSVGAQAAAHINTTAVSNAGGRIATSEISAAPGSAAGYLPVFTDSSGDVGNSALFQSGTFVGIGTAAPATTLNVVGTNPTLRVDNYSNTTGDSPNFNFLTARGTSASPGATLNGDNLGQFAAAGFNSTTFPGSKIKITFMATENWTPTANGTAMSFQTTTNRTTVRTERMRIDNTGNVGIGTPAPAYPLSVNGVVQSLAGGFVFPDGSIQVKAQPANLAAISTQLGTSGYNGANFAYAATCMIGDIILSVNAYGGGGAAIPADGRLLPINTSNYVLLSVLGTRFGGDGITTFAVPDMRSFAPQGLQYSICVMGIYPSRN